MAEANPITETRTIGITLKLTLEEAITLQAVCGLIQGSSKESRRKHTDAVYHALRKAGIRSEDIDAKGTIFLKREEGL
jgi:hypothetical protein